MSSVRLRIRGRVQGVGYRAWATETARRLGLCGWVRNRADDSVEMLVTGDEDAIAAMTGAARQGPSAARVINVEVVEESDDGSGDFVARPTE
jgi:acylphosphatase